MLYDQRYILNDWRFRQTHDGILYCSGTIGVYNKGWETSQVVSVHTYEDHYIVETLNSTYYLYW